jgi:hypothetical protein
MRSAIDKAAPGNRGLRFNRERSMIRFISTCAFVLAALSAGAQTLQLAHQYKASGTNPDGSPFTGDVAIESLSDTTFAIRWSIGGAVYKGFGMRRNDALSGTYMINGEPGLVLYHVEDDGRLNGLWAVRGAKGNGAEILTPAE